MESQKMRKQKSVLVIRDPALRSPKNQMITDLKKSIYEQVKRKDSLKELTQRKNSLQVKLNEKISLKMKQILDQKAPGYVIKSREERIKKIHKLTEEQQSHVHVR
jgi:hypothetical protein